VNPEVDAYIARSDQWPEEMTRIRPVLLQSGLSEQIKWGKPCYSHDGKNIVILQEMKDFLSLMFFKGALLDDPEGVLEDQGPNSRSARRMVFRSVEEIARLAPTVASYVEAAIDVEEAGLTVDAAPPPALVEELQARLDEDPALDAAFQSLIVRSIPGIARSRHSAKLKKGVKLRAESVALSRWNGTGIGKRFLNIVSWRPGAQGIDPDNSN